MPKASNPRKRWPRYEAVVRTRLNHPKWTARNIADYVGCSSDVVRQILKRANMKVARSSTRSGYKLQPHERQSIADLYAEGEKVLYIAHEYGISTSNVRKIAKNAGHPPRPYTGGRPCRSQVVISQTPIPSPVQNDQRGRTDMRHSE